MDEEDAFDEDEKAQEAGDYILNRILKFHPELKNIEELAGYLVKCYDTASLKGHKKCRACSAIVEDARDDLFGHAISHEIVKLGIHDAGSPFGSLFGGLF